MATLAKSRKELQKANSALERMKQIYAVRPIDAYAFEAAWLELLGRTERIWYSFESQINHHPRRHSWKGKWITERKTDPLLSFLSKSRGADEHSHVDIVGRGPEIREIFKVNGPTRYEEKDGNLIPIVVPGESYTIVYDRESMQLKPITFRDKVYEVPRSHLGKNVLYPTPITLAELGIAYYNRLINEAESFF